jgi:hypothetical protein
VKNLDHTPFLSLAGVSRVTGFSKKRLRDALALGQIHAIRVGAGGRLVVSRAEVERLLNEKGGAAK